MSLEGPEIFVPGWARFFRGPGRLDPRELFLLGNFLQLIELPGKLRVFGGRFIKGGPDNLSLFDKLSMETWLSLELALRMNAEFDLPEEKKRIWVHVDANPDTRYDSSNYVKQLAGMVAGSGFPVLVKPDAWCASHVADFAVKNKHRRISLLDER